MAGFISVWSYRVVNYRVQGDGFRCTPNPFAVYTAGRREAVGLLNVCRPFTQSESSLVLNLPVLCLAAVPTGEPFD